MGTKIKEIEINNLVACFFFFFLFAICVHIDQVRLGENYNLNERADTHSIKQKRNVYSPSKKKITRLRAHIIIFFSWYLEKIKQGKQGRYIFNLNSIESNIYKKNED
jgi:hypothetical protein